MKSRGLAGVVACAAMYWLVACAVGPGKAGHQAAAVPDLGQRLVKSVRVSGRRPGQTHIEIDHDVLRVLEAESDSRVHTVLRDPLAAAQVFSRAIGVPDGGRYELIAQYGVEHTEAGHALATVAVGFADGRRILIRLIASGGDANHRLWVPNDVLSE